MRRITTYILLPIAFCLLPLDVMGQVTMTLDECLKMARTKNLSIKNSDLQVQKAKHMQKTAFTLNPMGINFSQDLTTGQSPDNGIDISQEFEMPSVYITRKKSLKAQTLVASRQHDVNVMDIDQQVTAAYYNLLYTREKYHILMKQDSAYVRFHTIAAIREKAGETGRLAHLNADKLTQESRMSLATAKNDYLLAQYALASLMNTDTLVNPAGEMEQISVNNEQLTVNIVNAYSRLADAQVNAAEMTLKEVRKEALPTLSLEARYYAMIKGFDPQHVVREPFDDIKGFSLLGVGLNIPLTFGSHSAKVKAAKRDVEIMNNERQQQQRALAALQREKRLECSRAQQEIDYFTTKGLRNADEMVRLAQTSYEQGEIEYIELLENIRTASEARLQYADAVNAYNQAMIVLKSVNSE